MMKFLFSLIIVYLLLLLYFFMMQRSLIYYPEQVFPSPEEAGAADMRIVELETEDGLTLRSWWRPPEEKGKPTVIYFHGNAGHIGYRAFLVKPFLNKGYGVLLLTYRGYSGNPGRPSEQGLYNDARAAVRFVQNQGVDCIVLYGNSIGAGVAMQMATEFTIGALVLQSPFTSLPEVGQYHFPFFPVQRFMWDQFDSIRKSEKVKAPVLVIYGEADNIIPPKFGRRLFEALPQPKKEAAIPGKGHNNLFEPEIVIRFIQENIRC